MFSRIRRITGLMLSVIGFVFLFGMAGADDVAVMEGAHGPMLPLILKGFLYLVMMAIGAILLGGESNEDSY
jgi:succinate dehydrogenase/fumarate reductase cytochrome b subunit